MNDVVISTKDLRKIYRLYAKPSYRFRDMFGLLGDKPGAYTEHAAIDGIDIDIRRGEKVAIIGRNGAGKSTFLKLITNAIQPTSGVLDIKGNVHALLQIGTGFHPDFTGRENVLAYLAQLGVSGKEAGRRCAEAIAFAELEEYVDQPTKTYSTGMAVRLMFAASTTVKPDLLVLDEVLGVGDAYFAHKSYERIKDLCDHNGATAILVTHDIYSAVKICSRVIWIDRGRVLFDGSGPTAVKVYEDSIRQQEESRLRVRKQQQLSAARQTHAGGSPPVNVLLEIAGAGHRPPPVPVYIRALALIDGDRVLAALPLGVDAFDETSGSHLQRDATAWGDPVEWHGAQARPFLNYGSAFVKVAGVFSFAPSAAGASAERLSVAIEYYADESCELSARAFEGRHEFGSHVFRTTPGQWTRHEIDLGSPDEASNRVSTVNVSGIHGTGRVVVEGAKFLDANGGETLILEHGHPLRFAIDYRIVDPNLPRTVQVVVAWHRDGVQDMCRFLARDIHLESISGSISLEIDQLGLTDGRYSITILIAEAGYYDRQQTTFYSINPGVYCSLSRLFDIEIVNSGLIGSGTAVVGDGRWSVSGS